MGLSARKKFLLLEALTRVVIAWFLIRIIPYRMWRRLLGRPESGVEPEVNLGEEQLAIAREIAWAHQAIYRTFGSAFTCLMLALSARNMLLKRGMSSTIVLGVERHSRGGQCRQTGAHAWVKLGPMFITGEEGCGRFTPVAAFRPV